MQVLTPNCISIPLTDFAEYTATDVQTDGPRYGKNCGNTCMEYSARAMSPKINTTATNLEVTQSQSRY